MDEWKALNFLPSTCTTSNVVTQIIQCLQYIVINASGVQLQIQHYTLNYRLIVQPIVEF